MSEYGKYNFIDTTTNFIDTTTRHVKLIKIKLTIFCDGALGDNLQISK